MIPGAPHPSAVAPAVTNVSRHISPIFEPDGSFYNYAPCLVQDRSTRYIFYCANRNAGRVTDTICWRKAVHKQGAWIWSEEHVALSPGTTRNEWDSRHVCDPDVVAGRFRFVGQHYSYALFYLGCDAEGSTHNQVGVAFAHSLSGPWRKYPKPIISYSTASGSGILRSEKGWPVYRFWGVGQPAVVSLDRAGKVLVFYSRGEEQSGEEMATLDLSDMDQGPHVQDRQKLPTAGLYRSNGRPGVFLTNVGMAYNSHRDRYYMVREGDLPPADRRFPGFISAFVQLSWIGGRDLRAGRGAWKLVANIDEGMTGWPRNHNASILKDVFGHLPDMDRLTVAVSLALSYPRPPGGLEWLWSYRIGILAIPLPAGR